MTSENGAFARRLLRGGIDGMEVNVVTAVPFLGLELYIDIASKSIAARLPPKTQRTLRFYVNQMAKALRLIQSDNFIPAACENRVY